MKTKLCQQLGIEHPIIQAPIGSASTPELVAAVSNAGGLGMLSVTWRDVSRLRALIAEVQLLTEKPFGVNLVLEWDMRSRLETCLNAGVKIISTFWGDPAPYAAMAKSAGAFLMHTVGSVDEALDAVEVGVDAIVAQGWESGGHVRGEVTTMVLTPRVVDAVAPIPVIAAGGIGDGRGVAAALALGAQAAWLGTRFLTADEAAVHPSYQDALIDANENDTIYSTLFNVGWDAAPHRVIRNSTVRWWEYAGSPKVPDRPGENEAIAHFPDGRPIFRYSDVLPLPGMTGDLEALALYAGQSVGMIHNSTSAAQIIQQLVDETRQALDRLAGAFS